MFYLIILLLLLSYYFFMAPKSIRGTLTTIGLVGVVVVLLVLSAMSFVKLLQTPPEIVIGLGMIVLGYFALRDVLRLSTKKK